MIPESASANQIRIYESTSFPGSWKLASVALSGVSAADTIVFEHDRRWWLITSINPSGGEHCSELLIFYAEDPLCGNWVPHKKNPIFIDPARGRNGGLIKEEGRLLRVAQNQGFCEYGKSVTIFEIKIINENFYEEKEICQIMPNYNKQIKRIHTITASKNLTCFDYFS